jgi:hypothetical protein
VTPTTKTSRASSANSAPEAKDSRTRWAAYDVRPHRTAIKHFHHPVIGDLHLNFKTMQLTADPGSTLTALTAEAGSPSDDALKLLASWAATQRPADTATTPKMP